MIAVGTTSLRLLESAADEDGSIKPFAGETQTLHHARLPLQGRRSAHDQLPPAALDAVHAGCRLQRARDDAAGLCARLALRLSLLFLRRRLPAASGIAPHDRPVRVHAHQDGRRRATWRDRNAARHHPHAGVHAGRNGRDRKGRLHRPARRRRRRCHPGQYLSPDAAAGRRAHRQAGRPAQLHALAQADPHRQRRLSGDEPLQAAQDHRRGRHLPIAYRRLDPRCSRPSGPSRSNACWAPTSRCNSTSAWRCRQRPPRCARPSRARLPGPSAARRRLRDVSDEGVAEPGPGAVRHRARRDGCGAEGAICRRAGGHGFSGLRRRRPRRRRAAGGDAGDAWR